MKRLTDFATKLAVPLGIGTSLIGASTWFANMHFLTHENRRDVESISREVRDIHSQLDRNTEKTSRIEAKLDLFIEIVNHPKIANK